ncbi:arrestin domain protein [Babesia caballi]|uniref:Arrestin domain protein n=1 Tax=Babesia caballi TaxID=5871 RepID=A0AAV4LYX4_BABCB|nr:arrestin domain protein [Babesia caballi]
MTHDVPAAYRRKRALPNLVESIYGTRRQPFVERVGEVDALLLRILGRREGRHVVGVDEFHDLQQLIAGASATASDLSTDILKRTVPDVQLARRQLRKPLPQSLATSEQSLVVSTTYLAQNLLEIVAQLVRSDLATVAEGEDTAISSAAKGQVLVHQQRSGVVLLRKVLLNLGDEIRRLQTAGPHDNPTGDRLGLASGDVPHGAVALPDGTHLLPQHDVGVRFPQHAVGVTRIAGRKRRQQPLTALHDDYFRIGYKRREGSGDEVVEEQGNFPRRLNASRPTADDDNVKQPPFLAFTGTRQRRGFQVGDYPLVYALRMFHLLQKECMLVHTGNAEGVGFSTDGHD